MDMDRYDICQGSENIKIHFDFEDLKDKLGNFQYVCCNIPGPDLDTDIFEDLIQGCTCDSESCDVSRDDCACLKHSNTSYDGEGRILRDIKCEGISPSVNAILECNNLCSCNQACRNRVVQNGIKVRLEIFNDTEKGLGLRTVDDIGDYKYVCEYAGEVLTHNEARRRINEQTETDMNYIFVLNEYCASGLITTYIDPTLRGNIGRFLNHSCEPNLFMLPVRTHNLVPRLCFFTRRNVTAGEELTYDYGGDRVNSCPDVNQGYPDARKSKKLKPCSCKSKACSGFLPFDASICI